MNYVTITSLDVNNGLGCRVTLWVSGCKHKCEGCQNEWLQDYKKGKPLSSCYEELKEKLSNSHIKGLTISGGDPLYQTEESLNELKELIQRIRKEFPSKDIWIYSGFKFGNLNPSQFEIVELCDVMVDGKFELNKRDINLAFRGSPNQHIWIKTDEGWRIIGEPEKYFSNL